MAKIAPILCATCLVILAVGAASRPQSESRESLPPVYFNHSDLVVDPSAYDAIAQSQFLKEEFAHVTETTVRRSADQTVTGLVIEGRRTYLSIFKTGSMVLPNQPAPEGQVNFNMWIDDRTKLPLIRDSLARTTHTDARLSQISRAFQSRIVAPFDVAAPSYPDSADVRARSTVISRNLDVFRLFYPDLSPSQYGTTREIGQLISNRYLPELLMNDVTRFTVVVSHAELARLQETFEGYGYALRREGDRWVVTGPEIEFVLIPAADPGLQRRIAVELKLNRAYAGDPLHTFGAGSEIELHRDTATWRFPAGWHP